MEQGIKKNKILGHNIRLARKARKMTQEVLSARLQVLGCDVSRSTLAKIEAGIRHISTSELRALTLALCVSYDQLFEHL